MRIALLHYTLPPVIGGVERVIRDQAVALRTLGHEVMCFDEPSAFREWLTPAERGCPHPQADSKQASQPASEAPAMREASCAVIIHNVMTMPFQLEWTRELHALAAQHPHVRWVNWVHDVCAVNPAYAHVCWQEPVPPMVHVAVSGQRRADFALATGLPEASIRVIPNGIDLAQVLGLTPRIAELPLWDDVLVLIHPTRLVRRKNIELGLRVVAALAAAGCEARYFITGAPDPHQADGVAYHAELKALCVELRIESRVRFLGEEGPLNEADVRSLYLVADALLFPSTGEGFGLPLLEALAHRLPIFCSDLAVHREVLGEAGQYFATGAAPAEISAQIMRWHKENQPKRQRRHLLRTHDMVRICQEHLEPLLLTANQSATHDRPDPPDRRDPCHPRSAPR